MRRAARSGVSPAHEDGQAVLEGHALRAVDGGRLGYLCKKPRHGISREAVNGCHVSGGLTRPPEEILLVYADRRRQAIEEKFILDMRKNYTTFRVYFGLNKRIEDDPDYPRKKAIALLRSYADLHPHAIRTKTDIMVEHFETQVKDRIGKQAKAMVVTRSRLHAVRYKQMFDRVTKALKLPWKALVAFSGTVRDPETGLEYTEAGMNGFSENQTAEALKQPENRFLIVAEKFQTGFDQPLLYTMYVDKILSGVNAVQTLSRLNRIYPPDKEDTMVLDFANEADDIQKAFQPYYEATLLTESTDPNKLYDIKAWLRSS